MVHGCIRGAAHRNVSRRRSTSDYVHVFSVYADLDTECLRPYDSVFERYNTSTAPYIELSLSSDASKTSKG
ncbi:hypothetical protein ABVK25_003338 [Lepraria finkii]|uniref:Uncharacterized protein n=1 Tax=Lepraria finkii TaxID=1340010 RepID=A0ABR4BEM5_9LECA